MANNSEYSADVIRRYREMEKAKEFKREVRERVPVDLHYDEVTFSCGHKDRIRAYLVDAMPNGKRFDCRECSEQWLAKVVEDEQKNQLAQLRSFCEANGWPIVAEFMDGP